MARTARSGTITSRISAAPRAASIDRAPARRPRQIRDAPAMILILGRRRESEGNPTERTVARRRSTKRVSPWQRFRPSPSNANANQPSRERQRCHSLDQDGSIQLALPRRHEPAVRARPERGLSSFPMLPVCFLAPQFASGGCLHKAATNAISKRFAVTSVLVGYPPTASVAQRQLENCPHRQRADARRPGS